VQIQQTREMVVLVAVPQEQVIAAVQVIVLLTQVAAVAVDKILAATAAPASFSSSMKALYH